MKKTVKTSIVAVIVLFMLVGCGFSRTASSGGRTYAAASDGTERTEASDTAGTALSSDPDTSVSDRDASGEFDAATAVKLSPEDDLGITEAGVYVLSGSYEGMIVIEAGQEDKVQLVLENAVLTNEDGPAIYVRSADKVFLTAA